MLLWRWIRDVGKAPQDHDRDAARELRYLVGTHRLSSRDEKLIAYGKSGHVKVMEA